MVLENILLLPHIFPDDLYGWFMDMFIDYYDWVMVPNVYSMSQFAGGGLITNKPYLNSSNYTLKMSDYKKGEWCVRFGIVCFTIILNKHPVLIAKNLRFSILIKNLNKLSPEKLKEMRGIAKNCV